MQKKDNAVTRYCIKQHYLLNNVWKCKKAYKKQVQILLKKSKQISKQKASVMGKH